MSFVFKKHTSLRLIPHRSLTKHFPISFLLTLSGKRKGVLIAIRDTVSFSQPFLESDPGDSYVILGAVINNHVFTIVNLYAPNTNQNKFLKGVLHKATQFQQGRLILCGDFNDVADPCLDSSNKKRRSEGGVSYISGDGDLYDGLCCSHGEERYYFLFPHTQLSYSRIDMFLGDQQIL